jgi:hypothetical protein
MSTTKVGLSEGGYLVAAQGEWTGHSSENENQEHTDKRAVFSGCDKVFAFVWRSRRSGAVAKKRRRDLVLVVRDCLSAIHHGGFMSSHSSMYP